MTYLRRSLLIGALSALLLPAEGSFAQDQGSWNGTWAGMLGRINPSPIAISIAKDKVVGYSLGGAPFDIEYSQVTPSTVSFGDRDHYFMTMTRTGDTTAAGKIHGRIGDGSVSLTKQ